MQIDFNLNIKITDFGLSKSLLTTLTKVSTKGGIVGTAIYAAPEYLSHKRRGERDEKGDIYSFGIVAWELFTRENPSLPWLQEGYSDLDIVSLVLDGERLKIPETCILKDLITETWNNGN